MQYDHGVKAGNIGDVWKHAVLVSIASRIQASETFHYLESHSGAPVHDLAEDGEWRDGIGAVLERLTSTDQLYLAEARGWLETSQYPAGWVFFARTIARRVSALRIELCDLSDAVSSHYLNLPAGLCPDTTAFEFHQCDGFDKACESQADLVFLDPPFFPAPEQDWARLAATCASLHQRDVSFVAWYPLNDHARPDDLLRAAPGVTWEVSSPTGAAAGLTGCGIFACESLAGVLGAGRVELSPIADLLTAGEGTIVRSTGGTSRGTHA